MWRLYLSKTGSDFGGNTGMTVLNFSNHRGNRTIKKRRTCEYCGTYTRLHKSISIDEIRNYDKISWPERTNTRKTVRLCNHCETRLHTSDEREIK